MKLIDNPGLECRVNRLIGAQGTPVPLVIFHIDLSRLQQANDDYSYELANQVLQEAECRLEDWLDGRPGFVMPIGTDHFLIVLAGRHWADRAEDEAAAIRRCLGAPMRMSEAEFCVDARVGVVTRERPRIVPGGRISEHLNM